MLPRSRRERVSGHLLHVLASFRQGRVDFYDLVSDVEALIGALEEEIGAERADELRAEWADLELIRALAFFEERSALTAEEQADISDALERLDKLVRPYATPPAPEGADSDDPTE